MRLAAIIRVTLHQLLGGKRVWALAALAALPAVVAFFGSRRKTPDAAFEFLHDASMAIMLLLVLPIVSLILGAAALGDERRHDTLSFLALRPMRRAMITTAKVVAAWLASFLVAGSGAVLLGIIGGMRAERWDMIWPLLLMAAINTLGYAAVFVALGYVTERAVLIGLGFLLIWETAIASAIDGLTSASIFRIGLSAYVGIVHDSFRYLDEPLGAVTPGAGGAVVKVAVLALAGVFLTASLLRRRDLAAAS